MSIARFENININNLTFTKSDFGESATVQALWFATRARVSSVANSLKIADKYRLYQDMTNFTLNFTPNMKTIVENPHLYSITYRGKDWRIDNARESDDRMSVLFLCYRSDPVTAV
jgi:hypothetical protein